jgi:hypothetical protein
MRRVLPWLGCALGVAGVVAVVALRPAVGQATGRSEYIGAQRCKTCHAEAYAQWRETPHARAHEVLSPSERRDPRCAGCHSTSVADGLEGVQCESCHGPGRHYWPDFIMRDVELARAIGLQGGGEPATCAACHTADTPSVEPFDHAAALPAVRHGSGDR